MGDGAGAVVVGRSTNPASRVYRSQFHTYSSLAEAVQVPLGIQHHPRELTPDQAVDASTFRMDSGSLIAQVPQMIAKFMQIMGPQDYQYVIPHQPSKLAMEHVREMFPRQTIVDTFQTTGNCVAASLPINLCTLFEQHHVRRGDRILLLGTGAGLGIGGMVLGF